MSLRARLWAAWTAFWGDEPPRETWICGECGHSSGMGSTKCEACGYPGNMTIEGHATRPPRPEGARIPEPSNRELPINDPFKVFEEFPSIFKVFEEFPRIFKDLGGTTTTITRTVHRYYVKRCPVCNARNRYPINAHRPTCGRCKSPLHI